MPLKLYDTMDREAREVAPMDGKTFRFYCCGPTVYGPAHIGNFRTFVLNDVLRRVIELSGTETKHVRNITDVDDKTIRDSIAAGKSLKEFTDGWKAKFHADCEALNLLEPHIEPSAVEHIPQQIAMIETLVEKGNAYQGADGSVYFKVESFAEYGRLSHLDEREITTSTAAVSDDEYERDSLADFALWKARKDEDGDNYWDSPWGEGRPGWHLECSAMSKQYLGDTFDLHSGGVDLIFPHHENEIAQSECCNGEKFANHWFHGAFLMVEGKKMAKSEGNMYTLGDLIEKGYDAAQVRYVLISGSYRQQLNFTLAGLDGSKQAMGRLSKTAAALEEKAGAAAASYDELKGCTELGSFAAAWEALLDDLNTPDALGKTFSAIKQLDVASLSQEQAQVEWRGLQRILAALGIVLTEEEESGAAEVPAEIQELAQKRWEAKQAKDWATSDALRDQVTAAGWVIEDTKEGFNLCPKT